MSTVALLEQAAFDTRLGHAAVRVLLALHSYYNRDEGKAWPSQGTVAARLGITRQAVGQAIRQLVEFGYVEVEARPARPGAAPESNLYRLGRGVLPVEGRQADLAGVGNVTLPTRQADIAGYASSDCVGRQADIAQTYVTGNLPSEPTQGNLEGGASAPRPRDPAKSPAKKRAVYLTAPASIELTEHHYQLAAGWGLDRARVGPETERFLDFHRAKASRFADWDAAWRTWMRRAVEYGARSTAARTSTPTRQQRRTDEWVPLNKRPDAGDEGRNGR